MTGAAAVHLPNGLDGLKAQLEDADWEVRMKGMRELKEALLLRSPHPSATHHEPPSAPDGRPPREEQSHQHDVEAATTTTITSPSESFNEDGVSTTALDDTFLLDFHRSCARPLAAQLSDLRSEVVREASACVTALAACGGTNRGHFPALVLEAFAPALLRLLASSSRPDADQGHLAAVAAFPACRSPDLVKLLADEMEASKSAALRGRIMEYVSRVLGEWPVGLLQHCQGDAQRAVSAGFRDEAMDVRRGARSCFHVFEAVWPARAARLLAALGPQEQQLILCGRLDSPEAFGSGGGGKVWQASGWSGGGGGGGGGGQVGMRRMSDPTVQMSALNDSGGGRGWGAGGGGWGGSSGEWSGGGDRLISRGGTVSRGSRDSSAGEGIGGGVGGGVHGQPVRGGGGGGGGPDRRRSQRQTQDQSSSPAPGAGGVTKLAPLTDGAGGSSGTVRTAAALPLPLPPPLYDPSSSSPPSDWPRLSQRQRRSSTGTSHLHPLSPIAAVRSLGQSHAVAGAASDPSSVMDTVGEEQAIMRTLRKLDQRMVAIRERRASLGALERPPVNKMPIESASPLNTGVGGLGLPLREIQATERKTALAHIQAEWGGRGGGGEGDVQINASGGGGDAGDSGGGGGGSGGGERITPAPASFFSGQRKSTLAPIAPRAAA